MIDNEIKIRIKIIAGYLLVAILIIITGWWIYANVLKLTTSNPEEYSKMYEKSAITSSVISHLYQVDYNGNQLTQSYSQKALTNYNNSRKILYLSIDSLKTKITSVHQSDLVQELYNLLEEKNKNTLELAKIRQKALNNDYYARSIENVIKSNDGDSIEKTVVVSRVSSDTIRTNTTQNRNFFQRVGDVFVPKKSTEENVQIVATLHTDTLRSKQSPSDSIRLALHKAKKEILTNRLSMRQTVTSKLQKLIVTELQISEQISLIIAELNHEATMNNIDDINSKRDTLQNAGRIIAVVAVIAVLVIVLFLFFIFKDITSSARYKRELEDARIHAEALMTSRHKMLLGISHDIKAPLCSITGYLDLMIQSTDADVQKWSSSMKISSSYIMDMLTNLLEYARLETGKSVKYISSFDVDLMVGDVVTIFTPIAADKNISLSCDKSLPIGFISSDAMRIRQIVMNLLSNAVKFTDNGGVNIAYTIDDNDVLTIKVSDTGRGVEQSKLNSIFEEFTRVDGVEGVEGSGLGLAVVKGAVSMLGGTISVESKLRQGSVFSVSIPVRKVELECNSEPINITPLNILVVDDDPLQLRMMTEMMSRSGHTIYCASSLEEVNEIVVMHNVDMVLTDLQMGSFSGFKLLEELRNQGFNAPIIAVSASGSVNKGDMIKAGFNDFLCKPFTLHDLNLIVSQCAIKPEIASLYDLMGGDEVAIKEIMDLFVATTIENIKLLKGYLNDDNMDDAQRLCHKMLPMFLQLQFIDVANLLSDVDKGDFDAAKIQEIITISEELIAQYQTV